MYAHPLQRQQSKRQKYKKWRCAIVILLSLEHGQLWQYAQRQSLPHDKRTEEKIAQHSKELKIIQRGYKNKAHLQVDKASGILSANSNISKAMSSRKPKNPQAGTSLSRKSSATPNTSAASSIAASSAASSIASPTTSTGKKNRKAPDYFGLESTVCSVSDLRQW